MGYYDLIKKFVEEDYKDFAILVTCDNEHKFYHNVKGVPPIIWDWDNERFLVLETTEEIVDQNKHPMQITSVELAHIQFITAYIDKATTIDLVNKYITDENQKKETLSLLSKVAPAMMSPRTLKKNINDPEFRP